LFVLNIQAPKYDILSSEASSFLHPLEQKYLSSVPHHNRKKSFLFGRYCAKKAINVYNKSINANEVFIKQGIWGQPIIKGCDEICVSISHGDKYVSAFLFLEEYYIGIDLEEINCEKNLDIISLRKYIGCEKIPRNIKFVDYDGYDFAKVLLCGVSKLDTTICYTDQERVDFFIHWSLAEALSKALKCGLTVPKNILSSCNFGWYKGMLLCDFKCFPQYSGCVFFIGEIILSICYPKQLDKIDSWEVVDL